MKNFKHKPSYLLFIIYSLLFIISLPLQAQETRILSPDKLTFVDVRMDDGKIMYSAGYRKVVKKDTIDVRLLDFSPLGLYTNVGDFSRSLELKETMGERKHIVYDLWQSKQSHIDVEYQQKQFNLQTSRGGRFGVEFMVGNNNIAYRYQIPMQGETAAIVVTGEASGFQLPKHTTTFLSPQSTAMIGWKRSKPSYEEEYTPDEPLNTKSRYGQGYTFPCLFHVNLNPNPNDNPNYNSQLTHSSSHSSPLANREGLGVSPLTSPNGWVLISETGVDGRYCGTHLSEGIGSLYQIAFPMEGENNGFGSTGAQFGLPGTTPWRTITLGESLKPIVETTLAWDVVEQLYDLSPNHNLNDNHNLNEVEGAITPPLEGKGAVLGGRSTWSWIVWQDPSINYDDQVKFIDLASSLGWEYCLIDGGWETNIGRERMEQLLAYALSKGVHPFVWYNSNGGWNDAPQCAKNRMYSPIVRKKEMKWLMEHGVKGIKVDFFAGDKQETIKLYEQILSDANDYGLQVIFHGCTLPRGWEKMYPNYVSSEAVLASENLVFSQHFCDQFPFNATLHPFCRNAVGSMEFGGTFLQKRLNKENNGGPRRKTGDVFELATAIAFQSAVQNFALTPMCLDESVTPRFEVDFMRQVPTLWDETRFLDGYPGRYIVMARRSGNRWYAIAMNGQQAPLSIDVQLPMFAGQQVTMLSDGEDGQSPAATTVTLDKNGTLQATISSGCAVVLYK